jgi:hypothetical protein
MFAPPLAGKFSLSLLNVQENHFNEISRQDAKAQSKIFPSPNLAGFASLRDSMFFRFRNPKFNRKFQAAVRAEKER